MSRPTQLAGAVGGAILLLVTASFPLVAQDERAYEELQRPGVETPVQGYQRSDGIIVLSDASWCSHLLGSLWGADELTFTRLIDQSKKKQKKALKAAFQPATDETLLAACAAVLDAYRLPPTEPESVGSWARENAVIPETLARFLPADVATDPLATPPPIGDGARTSGFGARQSAPFGLLAGNYYVEPRATACGSWSGTIRDLDDPSVVVATVDGAMNIYDVPVGNYYWDVVAPDCDWSVDLVAVAPVPAPTPTHVPMVEMPRLVGSGQWQMQGDNPEWLTIEQARAALDAAGLVVGSCEEQFNFPIPPRRILQQDPAPGTLVEPGSSVNLIVRESGCDVLTAP